MDKETLSLYKIKRDLKQIISWQMLGGRKTVICEFLGTGMISVMPVPLLSVHPREYSQQGHIRYVPSVCVYRWTCPVPPHIGRFRFLLSAIHCSPPIFICRLFPNSRA